MAMVIGCIELVIKAKYMHEFGNRDWYTFFVLGLWFGCRGTFDSIITDLFREMKLDSSGLKRLTDKDYPHHQQSLFAVRDIVSFDFSNFFVWVFFL